MTNNPQTNGDGQLAILSPRHGEMFEAYEEQEVGA